MVKEKNPDRYFPLLGSVYSVVRLDNYLIMWFWTDCGKFMELSFLWKSFHSFSTSFISLSTKSLFPVYLCDIVASQYANVVLLQFIHLFHIASVFLKYCPYGNYYSITTPHSVCFWYKSVFVNASDKVNILIR